MGRGEAREAEEQVPGPRLAEGRGLAPVGSPNTSTPRGNSLKRVRCVSGVGNGGLLLARGEGDLGVESQLP